MTHDTAEATFEIPPTATPPHYYSDNYCAGCARLRAYPQKEANKRYGMQTAGEWRVKIVGNNEKE